MARGWQRVGMGAAMLLDRLDLFHFPAPIMARFCPRPAVVTFHDVAALSLHGDITEKERRYLPAAKEAARRAAAVIAVSESAGQEVAQHMHRPDTIVIPEGVDLSQFQPASESAVQAIRQQYDLDRFVLCVGTLQTRKNHLRLIQAFEQIQQHIPQTLVIVGGNGSGADAIHAYLAEHPNPRIRLLGYVEDDKLPALYSAADALALPSLWEGFGLPLLEAMACGTSVLTSDTSSLREVTGDAGVLINPMNIDDIAQGLKRLLTDENLRSQLRSAGLQRVKHFSWQENARRTIEVYRSITAN
jgi:glycosyltransferase involved in cell wall biosynthesis